MVIRRLCVPHVSHVLARARHLLDWRRPNKAKQLAWVGWAMEREGKDVCEAVERIERMVVVGVQEVLGQDSMVCPLDSYPWPSEF